MKKIIGIIALAVIALALAGCESKPSSNPLCCVWATTYNDGKSQVMFSFEESADLEIVIWHYDEQEGDLVQAEAYFGSFTADNGKIKFITDGAEYLFDYVLTKNTSITLTYEGRAFTLKYKRTNFAL